MDIASSFLLEIDSNKLIGTLLSSSSSSLSFVVLKPLPSFVEKSVLPS
jgi:hypothetical protein